MNPFAPTLSLWFQMAHLTAEAQMVIGMRMLGMAGMWPVTKAENNRMFSEKNDALREALAAQAAAMMIGATPLAIATAGLKPYRRRTRANARRLARRAVKGPRR